MPKNAEKYRIQIGFKTLSSTHGGFATLARASAGAKMRVVIHDQLDAPSRFGVLCHELAHILLGHLGSDWDRWWPARANLGTKPMEIEAEAVAFIVTQRFGLKGSSAEYVSRHLDGGEIPEGVSLDLIAKTAGLLERMARETMPAPKPRPLPKKASGRGQRTAAARSPAITRSGPLKSAAPIPCLTARRCSIEPIQIGGGQLRGQIVLLMD